MNFAMAILSGSTRKGDREIHALVATNQVLPILINILLLVLALGLVPVSR